MTNNDKDLVKNIVEEEPSDSILGAIVVHLTDKQFSKFMDIVALQQFRDGWDNVAIVAILNDPRVTKKFIEDILDRLDNPDNTKMITEKALSNISQLLNFKVSTPHTLQHSEDESDSPYDELLYSLLFNHLLTSKKIPIKYRDLFRELVTETIFKISNRPIKEFSQRETKALFKHLVYIRDIDPKKISPQHQNALRALV